MADELEDFLAKVNSVTSAVTNMVEGKEGSMAHADNLISALSSDVSCEVGKDGAVATVRHDRTVVNATASPSHSVQSSGRPSLGSLPANSSQDGFMEALEQDATERSERRQRQQREGARLKADGNRLFQQGSFEEAELIYSKALRCWPDHLALYTNRAASRLKLGRYQEALSDCEWALRIHDRHPKALYRQGVALRHLARYDEAEDRLAAAVKAATGAARKAAETALIETQAVHRRHNDEAAALAALTGDVSSLAQAEVTQLRQAVEDAVQADSRVSLDILDTNPDRQAPLSIEEIDEAVQSCQSDLERIAVCYKSITVLLEKGKHLQLLKDTAAHLGLTRLLIMAKVPALFAQAVLTEGTPSPAVALLLHPTMVAHLKLLKALVSGVGAMHTRCKFIEDVDVQRRLAAIIYPPLSSESGDGLATAALQAPLAGLTRYALSVVASALGVGDGADNAAVGAPVEILGSALLAAATAQNVLEPDAIQSWACLNMLLQPSKHCLVTNRETVSSSLPGLLSTVAGVPQSLEPAGATAVRLQVLVTLAASPIIRAQAVHAGYNSTLWNECKTRMAAGDATEGDVLAAMLSALSNLGLDVKALMCFGVEDLDATADYFVSCRHKHARIRLTAWVARAFSVTSLAEAAVGHRLARILFKLLEKQDAELQGHAVRALAKLSSRAVNDTILGNSSSAVPQCELLLACLEDPSSTISGNAAVALGELCKRCSAYATAVRADPAIDRLLELAKSGDTAAVQKNAASAIAKLAQASDSCRDRLRQLDGFKVLKARQ